MSLLGQPTAYVFRLEERRLARRDLADLTDEAIEAFWEKVQGRSTEKDEFGREPCWEWLGPERQGKGLFSFQAEGCRSTAYAHHAAYYVCTGVIPEGQSLRLCTPGTGLKDIHSVLVCVNPAHWKVGDAPLSYLEGQPPNGRHPLPAGNLHTRDPLFTQGDLRNIRAAAKRTVLARDVADAVDTKLKPDEEYLVSLAEKIVAALPESLLHSYRIVLPAKGKAVDALPLSTPRV